ncbi:hypothetical protein NCCP2222_00730 [Sporosarcina sp. NCCP-2222]|uniref:hypothetical protein n=1 Tax=Sporosarcina sp. NCCP-2222 TaxID=2935073 RepID=UPI00208353EE|nr:hypothetical protein [Sporosarcina sp. NCCP-2222]GKV54126.1 hypothetical protein NCCP2222_00730 [Sporosarcina sp. NCCP-2222]
MIRLVWVAIMTGIVFGVSTGYAVNGWDIEGAMAGLVSIVILAGVSTILYAKYRRALQESHS